MRGSRPQRAAVRASIGDMTSSFARCRAPRLATTLAFAPSLLALVALTAGCGGDSTQAHTDAGTDAGATPDAGMPWPACAGMQGPWDTQVVPGTADGPVSMAIAAGGAPTVIFQGPGDGGSGEQLYLAERDAMGAFGSAKLDLLQAAANRLYDPTLASDDTGAVYAVFGYMGGGGVQGVVLTALDGTHIESVDPTGPSHLDFAIAPDGTARIAYTSGAALYFTQRGPTSHTQDTIDNGMVAGATRSAGAGVAVTVDAAGTDHVSYATFSDGGVWYATDAGGSWTTDQVANDGHDGAGTAIAVAGDGTVHVFYRRGDGSLQHAQRAADGTWAVDTVDASQTGGDGVVAAFDSGGTLQVIEYDGSCPFVRHDWYASGSWQSEGVAAGGSSDLDFAVDPAGGLYAAWRDGTHVVVGHRAP